MSILIFTALLVAHYIGDAILQRAYLRRTKSTSNLSLSEHVMIYGNCLIVFIMFLLLVDPTVQGINLVIWVVLNAMVHWIVDYISSRTTSILYRNNNIWWMMNVIVLDQLIHIATLFITFKIIFT